MSKEVPPMFVLTTAVSRSDRDHTEWVEAARRTGRGLRSTRGSGTGSISGIGSESNRRHARPGILARALVIFLLALAVPHAAVAQVLYGSLTGNVTDQTGAVVTGAKVEVVNLDTSVARSGTTDDRGVYLFSDLQPGVYKVTIAGASFKTVEQKELRVAANTVRRLDVQLQPSGVSETISVAAQSAQLRLIVPT